MLEYSNVKIKGNKEKQINFSKRTLDSS